MPRFCSLLAAAIPLIITALSVGEDFRIETKIYQADEAISEAVTLFSDGVVYDFLAEPSQIAVFRRPAENRPGRFILLDPKRKVRTELTTSRITGALKKVQKWAGTQQDPMLRFAADPDFDESYSGETGKLVLASYLQTYRLDTSMDGDPESVAQYYEYLDWYTKLNAMHHGMPPRPRMEVNAALEKHGVIPTSVELTLSGSDEPVLAEHDFTWRISQQDEQRIEEVRNSITEYRPVSNAEFLKRR